MAVQTVIKVRRDTAANWTSVNPVLASGEIGFETDSNKLKIGNGSTAWATLPYASGAGGVLVSDTPPADPDEGAVWFNSSDLTAYVFYDLAWVELSPAIPGPQGPAGVDLIGVHPLIFA